MTGLVLPDAGTDPAGYVLAVADLRETRATACVGKEDPDEYPWYREDDIAGVMRYVGPEERAFIAAERPRHALAEVALWRAVVAAEQCFGVEFRPVAAAVVAAARAYLGGQT